MVLKLKSRTVVRPLTFTCPLVSCSMSERLSDVLTRSNLFLKHCCNSAEQRYSHFAVYSFLLYDNTEHTWSPYPLILSHALFFIHSGKVSVQFDTSSSGKVQCKLHNRCHGNTTYQQSINPDVMYNFMAKVVLPTFTI